MKTQTENKNGDSAKIEGNVNQEHKQKIAAINKFCLAQMKMCAGREDEYNQGISLVACKIHSYIVRTVADEMGNLSVIDDEGVE